MNNFSKLLIGAVVATFVTGTVVRADETTETKKEETKTTEKKHTGHKKGDKKSCKSCKGKTEEKAEGKE